MIAVQYMNSFHTKIAGDMLHLTFSFQYLTIAKDKEVFHFIPLEGKEIVVNLADDNKVQNLSEVFVFQRGNKFIRMPLYQFMLVSNVDEFLTPLIRNAVGARVFKRKKKTIDVSSSELEELLLGIDEFNLDNLIDEALSARDEKRFYELTELKKKRGK